MEEVKGITNLFKVILGESTGEFTEDFNGNVLCGSLTLGLRPPLLGLPSSAGWHSLCWLLSKPEFLTL